MLKNTIFRKGVEGRAGGDNATSSENFYERFFLTETVHPNNLLLVFVSLLPTLEINHAEAVV